MAMQQTNDDHQQQQHHNHSLLLDVLYCEEEKWEVEEEGGLLEEQSSDILYNNSSFINNDDDDNNGKRASLFPLLLLEQDLFWEDEELLSLFSKEKQQQNNSVSLVNIVENDLSLLLARREAVEWMLKVNAYYGFTALTAILAINYFDGFLSSLHFQRDKPWMIQLVAVTCLSLAAKVEETQVPLLLDLQDTKYVFEAKTIQRMELLVLSTLQWKMHPVTPLSFLDHIIRRLGLKTHLHWEFLRLCEHSRFMGYLPSVLATATMMRIIDHVEPCNAMEYQNQLLGVLKTSKEKVEDCYSLIVESSSMGYNYANNNYGSSNNQQKRKHDEDIPGSPSGLVDAIFSVDRDSSNDSWSNIGSSSSLYSCPEPLFKKARTQDQNMNLTSLNRVFVDVVGSPPYP
ncbi:hypothetical protein FEM48_Zijuj09G0126800 [Ziziphus jujuba var. spinosa]|uniref:B-like cyclin n=1 Tax=Ziziphus jujuba var. spinosa TaxID=714518 RepID=A0A978UT25_ZIZJJ|nr:hypothetical protein FEM48_Zijuj09G0126800 [Ziziphus jujuba var. spinosa]